MSKSSFFDGNAVAGELADVFSVDTTSAVGQCGTCGKVAPLGEAHVHAFAPGIVVCCSGCEQPLVRLVKGTGRTWLDMRGLIYLQFEIPS
jgi:Family of unknown function (DUF6510)